MKKLNIILVILIVSVLGFVGYKITQNKDEGPQSQLAVEEITEESIDQTKEKRLVYDLGTEAISMMTSEDVDQLPDYTPQSFIDYVKTKLANNDGDEYGCRLVLVVSKISEVNISGGGNGTFASSVNELGSVTEDSSVCGSGAPVIWVLVNGEWTDEAWSQGDSCEELKTVPIYSEFIETCYNPGNSEDMPNPNGSIYDAL